MSQIQPKPASKSVITKFVHPLILIKNTIKRKFSLRRKAKPGQHDPRVARQARKPPVSGGVLLTTNEKKLLSCNASQNLWYEYEDRLCNSYWVNDATGEKIQKKPKFAIIVNLMNPRDEDGLRKRLDYLRTRARLDYPTQARQLLVLSENESIQRMRIQASLIGPRQLANAKIRSIDDLLQIVGLTKLRDTFEKNGVDLSTAFFFAR